MRKEEILATLRKVIGLAMILAGISSAAVQLANGGAPPRPGQASPVAAQAAEAPRVENAKLETRTVGASLDAAFREILNAAEQEVWVGYSVDQVAGNREACCNNNWNDGNCGTCRLEKENSGTTGTAHADGNVKLESGRQLVVLYRLEAKQVVKIRVVSNDCTLDAGGLPFFWLTGVKPADSIALLTTYVRNSDLDDHGSHRPGSCALTAITWQSD